MGGQPRPTYQDNVTSLQNLEREQANFVKNKASNKNMLTYKYGADRENAIQKAEIDAGAAVTARRTKAINDSSKLLTDFELQNQKRLMKAKTGTGQVGEEDRAITQANAKEAQSLLNLGSEYWDAQLGAARSTAATTASTAYDKETGTLDDFLLANQDDSLSPEEQWAKDNPTKNIFGI